MDRDATRRALFSIFSQPLYGAACLKDAHEKGVEMTSRLNQRGGFPAGVTLEFGGVITTQEEALAAGKKAADDPNTIGHLGWCKTFAPAGNFSEWMQLTRDRKVPFGLLHTQYDPRIPWPTLDQVHMNWNQDAHGGREFSHGLRQCRVPFTPFSGNWKDQDLRGRLSAWLGQCQAGSVTAPTVPGAHPEVDLNDHSGMKLAVKDSRTIRCVRLGGKMRHVWVTDGNPGKARKDLGWEVLDLGVGELADAIKKVRRDHLNGTLKRWFKRFDMTRIMADPVKLDSVVYQAKIYVAIKNILRKYGATAFTTCFEQTHDIEALPGLAVQQLMQDGIGFGPEGDWKIACLGRLIHLALQREFIQNGWWTLMEPYIYDFIEKVVLGSHMLEISLAAGAKAILDVFELTIGRSGYPARALFDSKTGPAFNLCLLDMIDHWELVAWPVTIVEGKATPKLPTAKSVWQFSGGFTETLDKCLLAGVCHHNIQVLGLNSDQIAAIGTAMPNTQCVML